MTFNVITKQLERIIQQTSPPDVRAKQEQAKKENAETFCETVTVENSTINFGKSSDDKKIAKHETAALIYHQCLTNHWPLKTYARTTIFPV